VPVACVVHHDVEAAEVLVRLLYGGEVGLAVGDVQLDRQHGVAVVATRSSRVEVSRAVAATLSPRSRAAMAIPGRTRVMYQ